MEKQSSFVLAGISTNDSLESSKGLTTTGSVFNFLESVKCMYVRERLFCFWVFVFNFCLWNVCLEVEQSLSDPMTCVFNLPLPIPTKIPRWNHLGTTKPTGAFCTWELHSNPHSQEPSLCVQGLLRYILLTLKSFYKFSYRLQPRKPGSKLVTMA